MMTLLYETDLDTMVDYYSLMSDLGNKIGEFIRIALGFSKI